MNYYSLACVTVMVLVASADFRFASCSPPESEGSELGRWFPEMSSRLLHPEYVPRYLSDDRIRNLHRTIVSKYGLEDILAMRKPTGEDFTKEKFQANIALCDNLKPTESMHKSYKANLWTRKHRPNDEYRVYVFYKNLHDFCIDSLNEFHFAMKRDMKVNAELDKAIKQLGNDVWKFCIDRKYGLVYPSQVKHSRKVMAAFIEGKQPAEVGKIKKLCSDFYEEVKFVVERPLNGHKTIPFQYDHAYAPCEGLIQV